MVSSSCRQHAPPKEPGRTRDTGVLSGLGFWGSRAQPSRWWSVVPCSLGAVGQALAEGFSGTRPPLDARPLEAGILPSSLRQVRCRKVRSLTQGPAPSAHLWAVGPLPQGGESSPAPTGF